MNVFMQGMRRSGTTLVFDLFWEDGTFKCLYEPLAAATKPAYGGGSEAHADDLFAPLREAREAFLATRPWLNVEDLNYGGPRDPQLEFDTELPVDLRDYLRSLLGSVPGAALKFTRMACKVDILHEIDPDAVLIHIVRDPRAVTASYLFGKRGRNRAKVADPAVFFERVSTRTAWSSGPLSEHLLSTPEYEHLRGSPDFYRILLLWKHSFERTHEAGRRLFGERYLVLRHEDLVTTPDATLDLLYGFLGRRTPEHVRSWLHDKLSPRSLHEPDDPRWRLAYERIGMFSQLAEAGYPIPH